MWRVLTGKHKSVEYSMMEAGHTKFHPDWHFGLWKIGQGLNYGTLSSMVLFFLSRDSLSTHIISKIIA